MEERQEGQNGLKDAFPFPVSYHRKAHMLIFRKTLEPGNTIVNAGGSTIDWGSVLPFINILLKMFLNCVKSSIFGRFWIILFKIMYHITGKLMCYSSQQYCICYNFSIQARRHHCDCGWVKLTDDVQYFIESMFRGQVEKA